MSPCTKRLQRSTRSLAPFSGLKVDVCACASGGEDAGAGADGRRGGDAGRAFEELAAID